MVQDLATADLADMFLAAKVSHCAPTTVRKYQWALRCLERVYPVLPRVTRDIIGFVQAEPLRPSSRRVLYETLRDFYRWIKTNKDPLAPELPYVWFTRKRKRKSRSVSF